MSESAYRPNRFIRPERLPNEITRWEPDGKGNFTEVKVYPFGPEGYKETWEPQDNNLRLPSNNTDPRYIGQQLLARKKAEPDQKITTLADEMFQEGHFG